MELSKERHRQPARQLGLSLIEALIAAGIFLAVVIGVLPLFTRATINNVAGRESTGVANVARSRVEELLQLPFNSAGLTIQAGSESTSVEYLAPEGTTWSTTVPTDGTQWTRTTVIRQYNVSALDDGVLDPGEALPSGSDVSLVHLKEIEVNVTAGRASSIVGPTKTVTVRVLKSK